jgi:hypothetical protein
VLAAWGLAIALFPGSASRAASDAVRVQADGVAPLPPSVPGKPAPTRPDAATLRQMRQAAVANGVEAAVLAHARELTRMDKRDDEEALRAALGPLADYALGHGVLADLGAREAKPRVKPGDPPPRQRPSDPVPMEHAWRVEALVDSARVLAALDAAGLALASSKDSGTTTAVVLEAPYDAPGLAALRQQLATLGAISVVPRRYEAAEVVLAVRGLAPDVVVRRLAALPPAGYRAEVAASEIDLSEVRVRLAPDAAQKAAARSQAAPPD